MAETPSAGDWKCPDCGNVNLQFITVCVCGIRQVNEPAHYLFSFEGMQEAEQQDLLFGHH